MKVVRVVMAIVVLAVVTVLSLRAPVSVTRFWGSAPSDVFYDGQRVDARVLFGTVNSAFDLLLLDAQCHDGRIYVVNLTSHQVSELEILNYQNASSPPSASALKPLAVTDVVVESWHVEFTKPDGSHIRVEWTANM